MTMSPVESPGLAGEAVTAGDGDGVGCGSSFCAEPGRHALSEIIIAMIHK